MADQLRDTEPVRIEKDGEEYEVDTLIHHARDDLTYSEGHPIWTLDPEAIYIHESGVAVGVTRFSPSSVAITMHKPDGIVARLVDLSRMDFPDDPDWTRSSEEWDLTAGRQ